MMHRLILEPASGQFVVHRDGNGLDNRRGNLVVTDSRSMAMHLISARRVNPDVKQREYYGVARQGRHTKHRSAIIMDRGQIIRLGLFKTARDAALAYDFEARKLFGEKAVLNFPRILLEAPPPQIPKRSRKSRFRGVRKMDRKWAATLCPNGKQIFLGRYETEEDAARAYDHACMRLFEPEAALKRLNFPDDVSAKPPTRLQRSKISPYRGVSRRGGGWEANISIDGRMRHLGTHPTQKAAALAYTFAWGRNIKNPGSELDGFLLESAVNFSKTHTIFGRAERVTKDELFPEGDPLHGRAFTVNKVSLGYIYDFPKWHQMQWGLGGVGSASILPDSLTPAYGDTPLSFMLFVRVKL
jgi:hypothetical protein